MFNGKINYFDWAIFNSYVNVYQRVYPSNETNQGSTFIQGKSYRVLSAQVQIVIGGNHLKYGWRIRSL